MPYKKTRLSFIKKQFLFALIVILLILVTLFVLEKKQITNIISKKTRSAVTEPDARTTSTAPTAQEDFSDGNERPIARSDKQEGTIKDTSGTIPSIPDQSQWTSSSDEAITVYSPGKNSLIASGGSISGISSLPRVSFRLIDDVNGVIAQGSLSVVNGNFSGTFSFTTSGTNGRLDIFSTAMDGTESSNVEIPVRFR